MKYKDLVGKPFPILKSVVPEAHSGTDAVEAMRAARRRALAEGTAIGLQFAKMIEGWLTAYAIPEYTDTPSGISTSGRGEVIAGDYVVFENSYNDYERHLHQCGICKRFISCDERTCELNPFDPTTHYEFAGEQCEFSEPEEGIVLLVSPAQAKAYKALGYRGKKDEEGNIEIIQTIDGQEM